MNKTKISITIIVVLVITLIGSIFLWKNSLKEAINFAKPGGILNTSENDRIQSNINTFMESQVGQYDLGKENYHCSNLLYGYDDKYAYAWVYCSGFIVKDNTDLEQGTAFSIPTRLEYGQPNSQMIGYKQPGDGNLYDTTLRQIFPKKFYDIGHPSNAEVNKLDQEVRSKTKAVIQIKAKYPELKGYPSDKLPSRSIMVEQNQNNIYVAFIQNGSGRPILEARCFLVKPNEIIIESGKYIPSLTGNQGLNFSAKECNSY